MMSYLHGCTFLYWLNSRTTEFTITQTNWIIWKSIFIHDQLINQWIHKSINHLINHSILLINQSIHQSINLFVNQSIHQQTNPPINQFISQSITQSINPSINKNVQRKNMVENVTVAECSCHIQKSYNNLKWKISC